MKIVAAILTASLATAPGIALAQSTSQDSAPGQKMQDKGSKPGYPGASGYAPGQTMQDKGSKPGYPGASGYAPGHQDDNRGNR